MRKRLFLLLATWPLLAHAEPHYVPPAIYYVVMAPFLIAMPLVVAQVVGRGLRWLLGIRPSLWGLSAVALVGCWLGLLYQPKPLERRELSPPYTGEGVSGDYRPPPADPGPWFLTACSTGAVTLVVVLAAWHAKNQWPE
jgi:hypothetical protein